MAPNEGSVSGGVYFLRASNGLVKIGFAKNFENRISTLRTASPLELTLEATLPGTPRLERQLHLRFAEQRTIGEWFLPSPELQNVINEAKGNPMVALKFKGQPGRPRTKPAVKEKKVKEAPRFRPTSFGGCVICNGKVSAPDKSLCHACGESLAGWQSDPRYPENHPEEVWRALHGQQDIWNAKLGPETWPIDPRLVEYVSRGFKWLIRGKPVKGGMLSLSLPASVRLTGAHVLRSLTDAKDLKVFDGGDGFYYSKV